VRVKRLSRESPASIVFFEILIPFAPLPSLRIFSPREPRPTMILKASCRLLLTPAVRRLIPRPTVYTSHALSRASGRTAP
jgi:hypothetical protein